MARAEVDARPGRRRIRELPKIILLGAGGIFLGWVVVQTSAAGALFRSHPAAALQIAPEHPHVQLRLAMLEFRLRKFMVTPEIRRRANEAFSNAPLAEEPLMLAGVSAMLRNRHAEAQRLFEQARKRNPRSRLTRLFLLDHYLRTDQTARAAIEMSVLGRLIPEADTLLIPELAKFALDPNTIDALERLLKADPTFRDRVLMHLASTGADPNVVLRVAGPPGERSAEAPAWQSRLLQRLVEADDLGRAHTLWQRFAGVSRQSGLYNPRFEQLPGPPPFNWTYATDGAGAAEPASAGSLEVQYYGRENGELAHQLLVLEPGSYRLAMRVSGDSEEDGSGMSWKISCIPDRERLASISLGELTYTGRTIGGTFSVPQSGCPGQRLALIGTAKEFPNAGNVTISNLSLSRMGKS